MPNLTGALLEVVRLGRKDVQVVGGSAEQRSIGAEHDCTHAACAHVHSQKCAIAVHLLHLKQVSSCDAEQRLEQANLTRMRTILSECQVDFETPLTDYISGYFYA